MFVCFFLCRKKKTPLKYRTERRWVGEAHRGRQRDDERESPASVSGGRGPFSYAAGRLDSGSAETLTWLQSRQGTLGGRRLPLPQATGPRLHPSILSQSLLWPGIWFSCPRVSIFLLFRFVTFFSLFSKFASSFFFSVFPPDLLISPSL